MESHYSRLIYSGESLLTAKSYFQKNEGLTLPLKGERSKKWNIHVESAHQEHFKRVKNALPAYTHSLKVFVGIYYTTHPLG